ncbi:hypothetical protein V8C40DRAFT_166107 [Trichoderma camerunense]
MSTSICPFLSCALLCLLPCCAPRPVKGQVSGAPALWLCLCPLAERLNPRLFSAGPVTYASAGCDQRAFGRPLAWRAGYLLLLFASYLSLVFSRLLFSLGCQRVVLAVRRLGFRFYYWVLGFLGLIIGVSCPS